MLTKQDPQDTFPLDMSSTTEASLDLRGLRIALIQYQHCVRPEMHYLIEPVMSFWRCWGAEIVPVAGADCPRGIDLAIVHVDLSRVPVRYIPRSGEAVEVINGQIRDIRKSACLTDLLKPNSDWAGPVIVKSDENHCGIPERLVFEGQWTPEAIAYRFRRKWAALRGRYVGFDGKERYQVLPSLKDAPDWAFYPGSVVQPFRPEMKDGRYVLREFYFFGDRHYLNAEVGDTQILTSGKQIEGSASAVPAELLALRARLKMDYGKIDYAMVDGEAVAFDINKTPATRTPISPGGWALAAELALGIKRYLKAPQSFDA